MANGWRLVWDAEPKRDGLDAFGSVEDDRANSHPGVQHVKALGTMYRFDIHHPGDVDRSPDRQRQEVKGMRAGGRKLAVGHGETWRFTWSWYLTGALKATTSFTHVHQMFAGSKGGSPVLVTSLRRRDGRDLLELNAIHAGVVAGETELRPLRSRWIDVELEARFAESGGVRWRVSSEDGVAVDVARDGLDLWNGKGDIAPKWGIYRSLKDAKRLSDAHLLVKDLRAYRPG